jgi:hypothetical protein
MQNFLFLSFFFLFLLGHVVVGVGFGPRLAWLHSGLGRSPWPSRPVALFLSFSIFFF